MPRFYAVSRNLGMKVENRAFLFARLEPIQFEPIQFEQIQVKTVSRLASPSGSSLNHAPLR
jgi:hypothetical protein